MLDAMDAFRLKKAQELRDRGLQPYAAKFDRSCTLIEGSKAKDGTSMKIAGRMVLFRDMGKLTFATLQDHTGRLQIAFREEMMGVEEYKRMIKMIDLGDFIGVHGERFTTQKGEPTVLVKEWTMLSKTLRQPPEKWHGLSDRETLYRKRYLDTMSNRESFERFMFRSAFIRAMREFYWENGYIEVDLPVLVNSASGALATPFSTHHNALDLDVFLRIALETHQKECLVGGFDRTFSIGSVFRNEGMDPSHLQEFTMCEHYAAYWDYRDNMNFTEKMLATLLKKTRGTTKAKIPNRDGKLIEVDFGGKWPRLSLREAIKRDCGIDFEDCKTADDLRSAMKKKNIELDVDVAVLGRGNLIDQLYKKVSRPKIVSPTFITEHPLDLSPLARRNDENPAITDRFQLVVGGWEIVNAYSELIDPVDQALRFT
ncbi:MAG: amino acid--tRNA ligase-related protein, partial [Patescibacteria group bacterium]